MTHTNHSSAATAAVSAAAPAEVGATTHKRSWIADVLGEMRRFNTAMHERYGSSRTLRQDSPLKK